MIKNSKLLVALCTTLILMFTISCQKETPLEPKDEFVALGKIEVISSPQTAEIFIDGISTKQKTPALIENIIPGEHEIKLSYPKYLSDVVKFNVKSGEKTIVYCPLQDTTDFVSYTMTNSPIYSNYFCAIAIDKDDIKWAASYSDGLVRFDGKNWQVFTEKNSALRSQIIKCISIDKNNHLWIGTNYGLNEFDGNNWYDYSAKLPTLAVTSIAIDSNGNTWVGTNNGLVKYDGTSWKTFQESNSGLASNHVTALAVDKANKIWVGTTYSGISTFDGNRWETYNTIDSEIKLPFSDGIKSISVDLNGIIWVTHSILPAVTGSLSFFDGVNWNKMWVGGVSSVFIDSVNAKWICTDKRLIQYTTAGEYNFYIPSSFGAFEVNLSNAVKDHEGELWIATNGNGIVKVKKSYLGK